MNPIRFARFSVLAALVTVVALAGARARAQVAPTPSPESMEQAWRQAAVHVLDVRDVPVLGPPQAPIQVVEYADFLCGTCRQVAELWKKYVPAMDGHVAVYIKNYPLDTSCNEHLQAGPHPGSCWLALGQICAAEQHETEAYQDLIFAAYPDRPSAEDVADLAAKAGLDRAAMQSCLLSPQTRARLRAQIAEAAALGVQGTPALFVNGKRVPVLNYFATWVKLERQRLGLSAPKGPAPRMDPE